MTDDGPDPFTNMFEAPAKFARTRFAPFAEASSGTPLSADDMREWTAVGAKLQGMWLEYQTEQLTNPQALAAYKAGDFPTGDALSAELSSAAAETAAHWTGLKLPPDR